MSPGLRLRPAHAGDAAALVRLNAALHARHVQERPEFFRPTQPAELEGWFKSMLERPGVRAWIAELQGDAVGYLLMSEHQRGENTFSRARHWHEIDHVAVEEPCRGRGIGRALIELALATAAETGAPEVEIASWAFNTRAHALFQGCGFAPRLVRFDARVR